MADSGQRAAGNRQTSARAVADELRERVETALRFGLTQEQIAEDLERDRRAGKIAYAPSARTIRSWIAAGKVHRPPSPGEPWSVLTGAPGDLELIAPLMPLVAALPARSGRSLSLREAEIAARVRRAAPDLPLPGVLTLALVYAQRERARQSTAGLDLYLGFAPWRRKADRDEQWHEERKRLYHELTRRAGTYGVELDFDQPGGIRYAKTVFFDVAYRQED